MQSPANTGYAQVLDTTNYANQLNQQSQGVAAIMIKRHEQQEKERRVLLKDVDIDLSKALRKRGEELQQRKQEAVAFSTQVMAEEGNTPEARAKIAERMEDVKRGLNMAISQQKFAEQTRGKIESLDPRKIDKEASLENLKKFRDMGLEEAEEYMGEVVVYKEPKIIDFLKKHQKQLIPANRSLSPDVRRGMVDDFMNTEDGLEFAEDFFDNDIGKARDYLVKHQDFNYNRYKDTGGKGGPSLSVFRPANFNKLGDIKSDSKDLEKVKEEISKRVQPGASKIKIGGSEVVPDYQYVHPQSTSVTIDRLEYVKEDGSIGHTPFKGEWVGYTTVDNQNYAVYSSKESRNRFDMSGTGQELNFYYSPVDGAKEGAWRPNTYSAYIQGVIRGINSEYDIYYDDQND